MLGCLISTRILLHVNIDYNIDYKKISNLEFIYQHPLHLGLKNIWFTLAEESIHKSNSCFFCCDNSYPTMFIVLVNEITPIYQIEILEILKNMYHLKTGVKRS